MPNTIRNLTIYFALQLLCKYIGIKLITEQALKNIIYSIMQTKLFFYASFWIFSLLLIVGEKCNPLLAQQTATYTHSNKLFSEGMEYFQVGNYALAQKRFESFIQGNQLRPNQEIAILLDEAAFYHALSAKKLEHPDAEMLLVKYIDESANAHFSGLAYYHLGQLYFANKHYRDVIQCYKNVPKALLSAEEYDEYYFQFAYSYFTSKKFKEAKKLFAQTKDTFNEYYNASNYYYGILSYFDEDYEDALSSFKKIEKDNTYGKAIPYYISLIYYHTKDYDNLLAYAGPKAKERVKYQKEINQLVGQTYFNKQQFAQALPYLEFYVKQSKKVVKEDIYQLGFTQYQVGKYPAAIENFSQLNSLTDSIGQNATYHLADSYLKINEKEKARSAFDLARKMTFDTSIVEVSDFNYAKLSYELGFHDQAIQSFQDFINRYPNSQFNNQAKDLLSELFETTQNYSLALEVLESIPNKTPKIWKTIQRVSYFRGVEMYNDKRFDQAVSYFNKSLENPIDQDIAALCHFWKGDMYFSANKFDESYGEMDAFIGLSGGRDLSSKATAATAATANYTMAYCLYKQKDYDDAQIHFDKVVNLLGGKTISAGSVLAQIYPDAILRSGDCNFMRKEYTDAAVKYDDIIRFDMEGSDYAYYQKGMILGLMGKYNEKITTLKQLQVSYPESFYNDDAAYQIALAQVILQEYNSAINTHKSLIQSYPESDYVRRSMVNLGLIYFNIGDHDKAISEYENVLKNYPQSIEAQEAFIGIKDVYISRGDSDGFARFAKKYPQFEFTASAQDSLTYEIAENFYNNGDCNNAVKEFTKYLSNFKKGSYALYAHFYRAQCLYSQQKYQKAGEDYDYIIKQNRNLFSEKALDKGARIALFINKDYPKAHSYFEQLFASASNEELSLESTRGLVKTSYFLKKGNDLQKYTNELLKAKGRNSNDEIDAYFYRGSLAYEQSQYANAATDLNKVSLMTTNEQGAKARYLLASVYFKQGNLDKAKDACFKTINETSSHEYWVIKSFLLLSDVYLAKGEVFQAKATLKSIIENYSKDDELKKEAREKLDKILKTEAATSKIKKEDDDDGYLEMDNQ